MMFKNKKTKSIKEALQPGNQNPRHFNGTNYFFDQHSTKMQIITKVKK